jgi:beta-galactosidase/beta-glucuronidase
MTDDDLMKDLNVMKTLNMITIRTSHYPPTPKFLNMCDELGFYVMLETDLETHGICTIESEKWVYDCVDNPVWLCENPDWKEAYVERMERAYQRDKNHCSIFSWSTGNESGHGDNHFAMIKYIRANDKKRLIHSEDASRISEKTEYYGEKVADMLKKTGKDTVGTEETDFGLTFDEDVKLKGDKAEKITVKFRWWKTTTMTYDKKTGLYMASQYDDPHIDENTGETLSYKNVFVLYVDQWGVDDGTYVRSYYDLVGSGKGHFATGGKIVPIQWHREDLYGPFSYTLEDGTPLTLGVGTSYFGIVHHSRTVVYE